jgi:hypothetical protein
MFEFLPEGFDINAVLVPACAVKHPESVLRLALAEVLEQFLVLKRSYGTRGFFIQACHSRGPVELDSSPSPLETWLTAGGTQPKGNAGWNFCVPH